MHKWMHAQDFIFGLPEQLSNVIVLLEFLTILLKYFDTNLQS